MQGQIDVLPAFENLTELKVSQLGENIRYVPLETTDSSLIGGSCKVRLLEDKIMATYGARSESHCFLFNGEVAMNEVKDAFTDDLTSFLPFTPIAHTPRGEFAGVLTIEQIQEWQEEHPDAKLEGALASLKDLDFDANPVVVIVEP